MNLARSTYADLLREARRATRSGAEAEDLFQTVWLAAVEAGRSDLSSSTNRRWFVGALRKRALFDARTAVRRKRREYLVASSAHPEEPDPEFPACFVAQLPPRLRTTALLVLSGHTKAEVLWLLRLNEPALRQRIADIRRRWKAEGMGALEGMPGLSGPLDFGTIRRALLSSARQPGVLLATHDPDGHLFVVTTSRKKSPRQLKVGSNHQGE